MHLGLDDKYCFCLSLYFWMVPVYKNDLETNLALITKEGKDPQLVNENHTSVLRSPFPAPVPSRRLPHGKIFPGPPKVAPSRSLGGVRSSLFTQCLHHPFQHVPTDTLKELIAHNDLTIC